MFLRVLEILVAVMVITQIIVPYMMNKRSFPLFRREGALMRQIATKRQRNIETSLAQELDDKPKGA
jgi:hypothetical protein